MKKFTLALLASAAMVLGFGSVANAYPPGAGTTTVSNATPAAGAAFDVTSTCQPGETVTFEFAGVTLTAVCSEADDDDDAGTATVTFNAPDTAGTVSGTAVGSVTGALPGFSVTVTAPATPVAPGGGLPATGSNSTSTMTIIAVGLFAVGAGLFGVSQMRRRSITV